MPLFYLIAIFSAGLSMAQAQSSWTWGIGFAEPRMTVTVSTVKSAGAGSSATYGASVTGLSRPETGSVDWVDVTVTYSGGRSGTVRFERSGLKNATINQSQNLIQVTGQTEPIYFDGFGDEDRTFSQLFGPEFAGAVVTLRDGAGNVLRQWVIPTGGTYLESTIGASAAEWNGNVIDVDGVPFGFLDGSSVINAYPVGVDRPGYAFNFDGSYTGADWEIRRPDGSVAASGTAASLGTVLQGRVTIGGEEAGEVYVRSAAGDGGPSVFLPTGVTVQGSSTTAHSFVNNPAAVLPEPMPTPATVSTPAVLQPAPTNSTVGSPTVSNPTNSADYVSVDVDAVQLDQPDDGEENVLDTIGELQGLVSGIVTDMAQVQGNFVAASQVFNGLRLGGVGRNCEFSFGPASITLQTSGTVRSGLTLLMIGVAAFGAASMIRTAIQ